MTALLRIVSTANPSRRWEIIMPGGSELDTILRMEWGSIFETDNGDGTVQMSFTGFAKNYPANLRTAVRNLDGLFSRAVAAEETGLADDVILIQMASKNEGTVRQAQVLRGAVATIDDPVVNASLERNAGRFAVTLTRTALWEVAGSPVDKLWSGVAANGGTGDLPDEMFTGTAPGRIQATMVTPGSGSLSAAWLGIKRASVGTLASFDPEINIGAASMQNSATRTKTKVSGALYVSSGAYRVQFVTKNSDGDALTNTQIAGNIGWEETLYVPFYSWNSTITSLASLSPSPRRLAYNQYIGRYRMLLRYKIEAPEGLKWGLRAASGWAASNSNIQDTKYTPRYLPDTGGAFQYVDLGTVPVGGGRSSPLTRDRQRIDSFTVAINTALFGADQTAANADYEAAVAQCKLWLDSIILVPADNFLRMRATAPISGEYRLEYQCDIDGKAGAYVVRASSTPGAWRTAGYEGTVREAVTDFEAINWTVPVEQGSQVVCVVDSNTTSYVGMSVLPRVQNYF